MHETGSIIDGKYEVVQSLGRGGMGEVLLVRHLHLEELRVIKILRPDYAAEEGAQKRFTREARLATQIKHPNVAILYDFAQLPEGSYYMVWEHIEGRHVGQWLEERGPFPVITGLELGIQTLRGLEAIHASGVIHRDLSPDNLMITTDRRGKPLVKIIDLGLAKNLLDDPAYEVTQVGMFMGKLRYCSPEQADPEKGEALDRRSDLYSFALVLYEMLTGMPPFDAESAHGSVMKRLMEEPAPISGRNPELPLPVALDEVFAKALRRDPAERHRDAVQLIEEIERVAFSLRQTETRKIPMPPARPLPERRLEESGTLSRAERVELLAQIERAAARKRARDESSQVSTVSPGAATAEPFPELTEAPAPPAELPALEPEEPPAEAGPGEPAGPSLAERRQELEQMLTSYMKTRQLPLAELTLATLVELFPIHPRRQEFEDWVRLVREEVEQDQLANSALAAGREAIEQGDFRTARKRLADLEKSDPDDERARTLRREIDAAQKDERQSADVEEHKRRFEERLDRDDLAGAEREMGEIAKAGAPRVTVDLYRSRLKDAREKLEQTIRAESFEHRFRQRLAAHDFHGARDVALELERALPWLDRPAAMFAEISRVEEDQRKQAALDHGTRQVEELIEQGQADQAALALSILVRMDPAFRWRKELERKLRALQG